MNLSASAVLRKWNNSGETGTRAKGRPMPEPATLSLAQTATQLGVCRRTVYARIRDGSLQTVRVGKSQRVTRESIAQWTKPVIHRSASRLTPRVETFDGIGLA